MSLALVFGDITDRRYLTGAVYFDAVTIFNREYSGKVTEHPIDVGASISDHFISNNPKFTINGVISSVDFSNIPSSLVLEGQPMINNNPTIEPVQVTGVGATLRRFVPDIITQFIPKIPMGDIQFSDTSERTSYRDPVENFFRELMTGVMYDETLGGFVNRMTTAKLFSVSGSTASNPIEDLVVTKVVIREDEHSGEEVFVDIELEKVTFVEVLQSSEPAPRVGSKTRDKVAKKENKGSPPNKPASQPVKNKVEEMTVLGSWGKIGK